MEKQLRTRSKIHWLSTIMLVMLAIISFDVSSQTFNYLFKIDVPGTVGHIAIDGQQRILVGDRQNQLVRIFSKDGNFIKDIGQNDLNDVFGIAVDENNSIYVSDGGNIKIFDSDGNWLGEYAGGNNGAIAINKTAKILYVNNTVTNRVEARNLTTGALLNTLPGGSAIAVDDFGLVRVINGTVISIYSRTGGHIRDLNLPFNGFGLAIDNAENYYFTKNGTNHLVTVRDRSMQVSGTIGNGIEIGAADGQFNTPTFLAIDDVSGRAVVSDMGNNRVQVFSLPMAPIGNFDDFTKIFGDPDFIVSPTAPSNEISYVTFLEDGTTGQVTITGVSATENMVSIVKAGVVKLRAVATKDANHIATAKDITLTIQKAELTVTAEDKVKLYGNGNPTFTFTYSGFKNGNTVANLTTQPTATTLATTSSAVGQYGIFPEGGASVNYQFRYLHGMLTVQKAPLAVEVDNVTRQYGNPNPTLTISYNGFKLGQTAATAFTTEPVASTTADLLSNVGEYDITVSQSTANNYEVTYQNGKLTVEKAPVTVTANNATRTYKENNPTFTATYTGFKNGQDEAVLNVPTTLSTTADMNSNVGDYAITAQGGDDDNYSITYLDGVLSITQASQQINFPSINDKNVNDGAFDLGATASSGLDVVYSVAGPASILNSTKVLLNGTEGMVTVTAHQLGNENYQPAQDVVHTFMVTTKLSQVITFNALSSRRFDEGNFNLGATASSTLGVTYTSSDNNIVEISGTQALVKGVGTVTITASQAGNDQYNAATPVSSQLVINKGIQLIFFADLEEQILGNEDFELSATSSALQPVTFSSSNTGVATINGETVTLVGAGEAVITASGAGNNLYEAGSTTRTLVVKLITGDPEYNFEKETTVYPNPAKDYVFVKGKHIDEKIEINMTDVKGVGVNSQLRMGPFLDQSVKIDISGLKTGVYLLQIKEGRNVIVRRIMKQ